MEVEEQPEEIQPSVFLTYLPSLVASGVGNRILEYTVAGTGGAQSILNLRKVHSQTKEWIDSISYPTMTDKIFFHIPFTFTLNGETVKRFKECPPPPPATSMILKMPITDSWHEPHYDDDNEHEINPSDYRDLLELIQFRVTFPQFFSFWTHRLQSLKTCSYDEALLALGAPKSLRHLDCLKLDEPCPSLYELKTLKIRCLCFLEDVSQEEELEFYRKLANSRNLCRLEIEIFEDNIVERRRSNNNCDDRQRTYSDVLKGLQLLIDTRKNDTNFQLHIAFRHHYWWCMALSTEPILVRYVTEEDIRSFVSRSVLGSSCSIQFIDISHEELRQIISVCGNVVAKEFFKVVTGTDKDCTFGDKIPIRYLQEFSNIEKTSVKISTPDDLLQVELPNSIQTLVITTEDLFPEIQNWPENVKNLTVNTKQFLDPGELIKALETISNKCSKLETLRVESIMITANEWSQFNWDNSQMLSQTKNESDESKCQHWFKNLRKLFLYLIFGKTHGKANNVPQDVAAIEGDGNIKTSTKKCLERVFRIHEMSSLLTLNMNWRHRCNNRQLKLLDSNYVDSLMKSSLRESLVSTNLDLWFTDDAKEKSGDQFVSAVNENKELYEERFGRLGARDDFFK